MIMEKIDWSKLDICIAEDSPTQLMLLKNTLENLGARVHSATDGKKALHLLETLFPDIIISDIEMPEMNGYDLCKTIKQDPKMKDIPVILLTNLSDPMDAINGIECGADNFLTKPCKDDLLFSSISDAVENRRMNRKEGRPNEFEFTFHGKKHKIKINHFQVIDLLLSTYSGAIEKNKDLESTNHKLSSLHLKLQKKNQDLTVVINEKNLLLGMAAHDLRNPLNVIQVYSDLIKDKLEKSEDEKLYKMISSIASSSRFMLQLVNDLLDISVIDLGKMHLVITEQDLVLLAKNNCSLNESLAEQKEIKLLFSHEKETSNIMGDASKIEQILNNLINNAVKFSPNGSKIEVAISDEEDEVILSVKDQGQGIPEEECGTLFESFGRGTAKATGGEPSTGLGLAIVKRIVKEHGGKIWVKSELRKGATFFVSFPKAFTPACLPLGAS